jgi:hypothetical protein
MSDPTILMNDIVPSGKDAPWVAPLHISTGRACHHILSLREWVLQHNRLLLHQPMVGLFHFGALVGKVILFTNFTWKLHLPLFFLIPSNISIRFGIFSIVPTSFLIFTLLFSSGLLGTLWIRRLHNMYI